MAKSFNAEVAKFFRKARKEDRSQRNLIAFGCCLNNFAFIAQDLMAFAFNS